MQRSFGGRISDIRPRGSLKSRDRPALFGSEPTFFGFFGSIKGDFFWVHPKKVGGGRRVRAERCKSIATGCPKSFTPRPLRERGPGVGVAAVGYSGGPAGRKGEQVGVKKSRPPPWALHPPQWRNGGPKSPLIAVERAQGSVHLAQLFFFFHSLFFSPKGSPLCDTKYRRKILFRNFPAPQMLQQTEKIFGRDSNPRGYTRARKEFRGIW